MEVDSSATEARFATLEQQVQSLTAHQQQMELAIDEPAKRSDSQITALQTQVTSQIDAQGQHIQGIFQTQLQQIEALLTKRAARHKGGGFLQWIFLLSSGPTVCCGIPLWTRPAGVSLALYLCFAVRSWPAVGFWSAVDSFGLSAPLASRLWCPQLATVT